jgi:transposase InsO family protein
MNQVFFYLGYSKQAFHQKMDRKLEMVAYEHQLLPIVWELRLEHPGMSARQIYRLLQPKKMGRDRFEQWCYLHGLRLERPKAYQRTTNSNGVIRFPNHLARLELTGVNQAYSSDITYYRINDDFYYLTFILDLYSRYITGFSVSRTLHTEATTIAALKQAIRNRKPPEGLVFHSDGGGQYYSKSFLALTKRYHMINSMGETVYENACAERINGTIKNQYLKGYHPQTFGQLVTSTSRAVYNYNNTRPHQALKGLSPAQFERISTNRTVLNKEKSTKKETTITSLKRREKTVNVI